MPIRQEFKKLRINKELTVALERTLSPARLHPYWVATSFDKERAIQLYMWNVAMGQSFHFPLQALEVSLRNCIHLAFMEQFREEWWNDPSFTDLLSDDRKKDIEYAEQRIKNRGLVLSTDQVITTLSLGFWCGVLHKKYYPQIWSRHLRIVFPNLPKGRSHKSVYQAVEQSLTLRNRIFHHEPLFGRDLSKDHSTILQMLGWMCKQTHDWVRAHSSVQVVLRLRP